MKQTKLMNGSNIELLKKIPDNAVDSVVTDPPYGLSFMNKKWDHDVPSVEFWKEVYRVLKPGGHVLSFGGTRTYHRMAVNIEDAGFEIRDQIQWIYGSGFPKSHNIANSIDKKNGAPNRGRAIPTASTYQASDIEEKNKLTSNKVDRYVSRTEESAGYEGWGTALKPANEPICVARKPLSEKTIADNVLKWGTGGINIEGCRIGTELISHGTSKADIRGSNGLDASISGSRPPLQVEEVITEGRFPANVIFDEEAGQILDEQSGISKPSKGRTGIKGGSPIHQSSLSVDVEGRWPADNGGGASRFFYCAKVSKKERNAGCGDLQEKEDKGSIGLRTIGGTPLYEKGSSEIINKRVSKNNHPTVKPIKLMAYLCRLVTPENGLVLDPFMGSGSTGVAARLEGFRFCGMELDPGYFEIASARIEAYEKYREI